MFGNLSYNQCLTNEALGKQMNSQFELVGKAIKIADYLVKSGKATSEWPDNVAYEVLCRMADEGADHLEQEVLHEES